MANVSILDSSETTMEIIEIVPRTNSCSFATGRDDSAIFMIIYHHMMKLDILLFGSQWNKNAYQNAGHAPIDLFALEKYRWADNNLKAGNLSQAWSITESRQY